MAGAPTIASIFAHKVVVGVGDMAVSNNTNVTLSTYALGSCVGVVAHDPVTKASGILHLMLPDSKLSADKAAAQPAMFADTGLPLLFNALFGLRAEFGRIRLFIAGGASVINGADPFKIGDRNLQAVKKFLMSCPCTISGHDVGGTINRTVHLDVSTGTVSLRMPDSSRQHSLAN
ncbi:chemoreceptor glutamine deamidase CheD [mine drainage metagenome]|uniref:Chemoreceptor glutamine deamidase CheD n=1 Tax=mine drainage metagenome TaxID=410659 RepID=A0A1J5SHY0_9ZZZZ